MQRCILVLVAFSACTTADRYRFARAPDEAEITVLVPGYEGTFLYEGDDRVYLSVGDALSRATQPLGTCKDGPRPLQPGGPVTRFSAWPYTVDVYDGLMRWATEALPGFTAFGYDWRADLYDSAHKLCTFIGPRRANIIAHSMGGLVTLLAANECGDHFTAVAFAGVPFDGAPGTLYDLLHGEQLWRNETMLESPALWTFPSKWQMLPRRNDFFFDTHGRRMSVELEKPESWSKWPAACPELLQAGLDARARMPLTLERPAARVLAIIGRGRKSLAAIRLKNGKIDGPVWADGDGAVTVPNATPPFASEVVLTNDPHRQLIDSPAVRTALTQFFRGELPSPLASKSVQ
jgi:pimeloyl-ACP methyl ester carboxylesterase